MWNLFKAAFKIATEFVDNGGTDALKKNIEADPQILTGDPHFDVLAADIFQRVAQKDPLALNWNDEFKPIVGLYDQATKGTSHRILLNVIGNIPEDLKCDAPDGFRGLAQAAISGKTVSIDNLVDKCRRGEHTLYFGTSKKDAIKEFKERAAQIYTKNNQPIPVPSGGSKPYRDGSPLSSDTQFEGELSEQGSYSSEYYTPTEGISLAAESAVITHGENRVDGDIPTGWTTAVGDSKSRHTASGSPMNALTAGLKGWTPATTLNVIAGTMVGFGLVAGVVLLYTKIFRKKRKPETEAGNRIHARSWNLAGENQM